MLIRKKWDLNISVNLCKCVFVSVKLEGVKSLLKYVCKCVFISGEVNDCENKAMKSKN